MVSWQVAVALLAFLASIVQAAIAEIVPGAYIVEFTDNQKSDSFAASLQQHGKVKQYFDHELFHGASVQLQTDDEDSTDGSARLLSEYKSVKRAWPVRRHSLPDTRIHWTGNDTETFSSKRDNKNETSAPYSPHVMTQVDRLHQEGYTGKGITIALLDTGVDYLHPALGGCFKNDECLVTKGWDFVGDDYNGRNEPVPDDDPRDCEGHGTHLAGIIAAQNNTLGFPGASPGVKLSAYRVFGCYGSVTDDILLSAFIRAFEDGADIISLSLGAPGGWKEHPWSAVMARIVEAGVPCIVAAGNDGEQGVFFPSNPADGEGVAAVASRENMVTPKFYKKSTYRVEGCGGDDKSFLYDINWRVPTPGTHTLWSPSNSSTTASPGCDPLDEETPDLTSRIVLFRAGGCDDSLKVQHAADAGASRIIIYSDKDTGFAPLPTTVPWNVETIATVEAEQGLKWIRALALNRTVDITFPETDQQTSMLVEEPNTETGGSIDFWSTWGPTWELDVKPQFAAPGGSILSTFPLRKGGYAVQSGTSMAAPLVAGIYALLGEVRGRLDAKAIGGLLSSTAKPGLFHDKNKFLSFLAPVPQQGAGAVQAYDAAFATAILQPSSLSFNDSDHHPSSLSFSLTNEGKTSVTYSFSNVQSRTVLALKSDNGTVGVFPNEMIEAGAELSFNKGKVTLGVGETVRVQVTAIPPNVDAERLALWSGWITVNGTDNSALSLPYQGLVGSLHDANVVRDGGAWISRFDIPGRDPVPDNMTFNLPAQGDPNWQNDGLNVPLLICDYVLGTAEAKAELVPVSSDDGEPIGEHPFFATHWLSRGRKTIDWNGFLTTGIYAPPGTYRFRISALRLRGDREREEDWQRTWTQRFSLTYQD
ncbi:subtilase family protein [Sarocladium implicatum]|nr:subtilase family protein [Sarocladium implicatum]